MKSPFTGGAVSLHSENIEITYREKHFTVVSQYYRCEDSGERFTTTKLDEIAINQVYQQYEQLLIDSK